MEKSYSRPPCMGQMDYSLPLGKKAEVRWRKMPAMDRDQSPAVEHQLAHLMSLVDAYVVAESKAPAEVEREALKQSIRAAIVFAVAQPKLDDRDQ